MTEFSAVGSSRASSDSVSCGARWICLGQIIRMSPGSSLPSSPTGPRSRDMHGVAREYSDALNREVTYSDIPPEDWERELKRHGLPEHLTRHLVTMAELHRAGRYDRLADGVERMTGRPAMSVREFVSLHADEFGGRRS